MHATGALDPVHGLFSEANRALRRSMGDFSFERDARPSSASTGAGPLVACDWCEKTFPSPQRGLSPCCGAQFWHNPPPKNSIPKQKLSVPVSSLSIKDLKMMIEIGCKMLGSSAVLGNVCEKYELVEVCTCLRQDAECQGLI
eukprot:gb/GFBE01013763.1/.p1 GENE.gb/GFBE01013763.1/~~gb/GFBE01013763.1/.p1  ORF type:complete len:142 (+),score=24.56 gb/GFBE01013763.1/:1-426(+)